MNFSSSLKIALDPQMNMRSYRTMAFVERNETAAPALADLQLAEAMKEGNRQALAELYRRHGSAMLALAERMLGNLREGEDVLQDVFVEAWRCAHQYDARMGTVRTWLMVRMRSRCLDRQRSRKGEHTSYLVDEPKVVESLSEEPAEDPFLSPDKFTVRKVLATLPPEQQKALELVYFEGLSSSEIARRLDIPQGTVKSRLSLALGKLRAALLPTEDFS